MDFGGMLLIKDQIPGHAFSKFGWEIHCNCFEVWFEMGPCSQVMSLGYKVWYTVERGLVPGSVSRRLCLVW